MNVLLIGHSFVRRLRDLTSLHELSNLNINNRLKVHWVGIEGTVISNMSAPKSLWRQIQNVTNYQAQIIFLDIGSTDLCKHDVSPENLVFAIEQ